MAGRHITIRLPRVPARIRRGLPRTWTIGPRRWTVLGMLLLVAGGVIAGLTTIAPATPTRSVAAASQRAPSTPAYPPQSAASQPTSLPAAAVVPSTTDTRAIRIRPGDTLWALARRYDTTVAALQALNGLGDSTWIYTGHYLLVRAAPAQRAPATGTPSPPVTPACPPLAVTRLAVYTDAILCPLAGIPTGPAAANNRQQPHPADPGRAHRTSAAHSRAEKSQEASHGTHPRPADNAGDHHGHRGHLVPAARRACHAGRPHHTSQSHTR